MDPNLVKIRNFHLADIRRGKIAGVLNDAEDYLYYIHGHDLVSASAEFRTFKRMIKTIAYSRR